ncbi:MAG TPA: hypothetical protein DEF36_16835 [Desulfotomaculum sp.]|nr:hypothetical protein [Desulfotomaculum sp.]
MDHSVLYIDLFLENNIFASNFPGRGKTVEIQNQTEQIVDRGFESEIQNTLQTEQNIRLTSAELANLWAAYMNSSLKKSFMKFFLVKVEDTEIRSVMEYALHVAEKHLQILSEIYKLEKHPIPRGFTDQDVNLDAPSLFSDTFILTFVEYMAEIRLNGYVTALPMAARTDIREYFTESLASAAELYNRVSSVLLSKGVYIRAPYIPVPDHVDFVKKQNFMTGFLGKRRPISSIEISHIFSRIKTSSLRKSLFTGFSQVAKSEQVRQYMIRGREIAEKHIQILSSVMTENGLPVTMSWESGVLDSTIPPFSDRLMMQKIRNHNVVEMANYGKAITVLLRHDLSVTFVRLLAEFGNYTKDGVNILIDNGWLEEPPQAVNPDSLKKNMH